MPQGFSSLTSIENGVTLYHPYLEFPDPAWLKQTLLLWDTVRRIVPNDYEPSDDPEVRKAMNEGAVLNTDPEPYSQRAGKLFLDAWFPPRTEKLEAATNEAARSNPNARFEPPVRLRQGKLPRSLAQRLEEDGTLRRQGNWYNADATSASLYMSCLATTMADAIGITCCTDQALYQTNAKFFQAFSAAKKFKIVPDGKWLSLGLALPTPEQVASVPMTDILRFRDKHGEARRALRTILAQMAEKLSTCGDENAARDFIHAESTRIQNQLDDYRQRLSDLRVKAVTTFFRIDSPVLAISAASLYAAPDALSKTLGVFAGFLLGIADWWTDLRTEYRDLTHGNPCHYLSLIQREFRR